MATKKKGTKKKPGDLRIERIEKKLYPGRFSGMSGKMAAIVGYVLGKKFTEPFLAEMVVTSDGFVMGRRGGDIGMNEFMGTESELRSNWLRLLDAGGLTAPEKRHANALFMMRVRKV